MSDDIKAGSEWLQDEMKANASRTVVYVRGAASVSLAATVNRSMWDLETAEGPPLRIESRDYLVHAADLVLSGAAVQPAPGDTIRETDGGAVCTYEVMAIGQEPCWRWSGANRRRLRIHTKLVSEA